MNKAIIYTGILFNLTAAAAFAAGTTAPSAAPTTSQPGNAVGTQDVGAQNAGPETDPSGAITNYPQPHYEGEYDGTEQERAEEENWSNEGTYEAYEWEEDGVMDSDGAISDQGMAPDDTIGDEGRFGEDQAYEPGTQTFTNTDTNVDEAIDSPEGL